MESPVSRDSKGELLNRVQKLRLDTQLGRDTPGRGGIAWLPWLLFIGLAIAWAGVAIRGYPHSSAAPASAASPDKPADAPPAPGSVVLTVKGYLVPARQIAVSPIDVAGRVVELNVTEGKKYNAGDILARIEDTSYKAMHEEAKAALASAEQRLAATKAKVAVLMPESVRRIEITQVEGELKEAQAQSDRAQDEFRRLDKIGVTAAGEKELNQARYDMLAASARVLRLEATLKILKEGPRQETKDAAEAEKRSAESDVAAAKARLEQADWRLKNCVIRSPITGTVLVKKAEMFNLANPNAFSVGVQGGASGSICEMADLGDLEVEVEIPERDLRKLAAVKSCRIKVDAYPNKVYEAKLDRVMPIAVRAKSIVFVRVKVILPEGEEPGSLLKPEMGAVVTFLAGEK